MPAYKSGDARYNVISVRMSDSEAKRLREIAGKRSVSGVMRDALAVYVAHIKGGRRGAA